MKEKILFLVLVCFLSIPNMVGSAKERNFEHEVSRVFEKALLHNNDQRLNSLKEPHIKLPEIREKTPIGGLATLPSTRENSVLLMGHFFEHGHAERMAFIWEISWKNYKISDIKVLSDLANPLMNELIVTKEYRDKFDKDLLVPSYFPFEITHVDGKVRSEEVSLEYKNIMVSGLLEIVASPEGRVPKGYKTVELRDGKTGLIGKAANGYEFVFSHEKMQYNVMLSGTKLSKKELVKVVESMFPNKEPWGNYQDNSKKKFKDANAFYKSLDWWEYKEFKNAKLNIRELISYKDINAVLMRADKYAHFRVSGGGRHPNRQVYVFLSVSEEGLPRAAVFDAETKEKFMEMGDW
ncbi:hypothetical protein [Neobacillus niacini]|uniref:hypothetical protein n=1 Tax=Neobacillus niacini TaxID=86668 RepID=UPI0021CAF4B6|nr:hypothetical protein [Neobacillus niacini]MCM3764470.1 hypothetical protein [Neobacillus niacini]